MLGEHREIHAILSILAAGAASPYRNHPEVRRWNGYEDALRHRHGALAAEMVSRGYNHASPSGAITQAGPMHYPKPWDDQVAKLQAKGCACDVRTAGRPVMATEADA